MKHKFTFSATPNSTPTTVAKRNGKINIVQLYSTLNKSGMLAKTFFSSSYVYKHYFEYLTKRSKVIGSAMKRDGFACACCGASDVKYMLTKKQNNYSFIPVVRKMVNGKPRAVRMTMDHNLLDSLGGRYDVKNTKALCIDCNAQRGNLFAEFNEFKYWYDTTEDKSVEPVTNFCYVDFKKNIQDSKISRNMVDIPVVPPYIKKALTERFSNGIIDLELVIDYGSSNFRNDVMNDLLNGLIQAYLRNHLGLQYARKPNYDFTDFPRISLSKYRQNQIELVEQRIREEVSVNTGVKQYLKNIIRTFILRK